MDEEDHDMAAGATGVEMPPERLWQPATVRFLVVAFGLALTYAVIRYHIGSGVPWSDFPLFILNKVIALTAVVLVASSYLIGKLIRWYDGDKRLRLVMIKFCGVLGFFLAGIHAFFSLLVMSPAFLDKYFLESGRMNLQGQLGMATGVFALFLLLGPAVSTLPGMPKALGGWRWKRSQRLGYLSLILVVAHLVALGVGGWITPSKWPLGLLPISLLALLVALVPLVVKWRLLRRNGDG